MVSPIQRTAWAAYAHAVSSKNKLGESIKLTGQLQFIRTNQARQTAGLAISLSGPTVLAMPEKDPTLSMSPSTIPQIIMISFDNALPWANETGAYMLLSMGRPQQTTKNYFGGPWRYIGKIAGNTGTPPTSPQAIVSPPFPLVNGQKVSIEARITRADGRLSEAQVISATVINIPLIFITDTHNDRLVQRIASDLSYVNKIGTTGAGNDNFNSPRDVCSDGTHLYIIDTNNHRVVKRLCSNLSYVAQVGTNGVGNDQFAYPIGICTDGTYFYVADSNNHRIVKRLCSDLSYVSKIGTQGAGDDQFNNPHGVGTDGTYIYVADTDNHRIVKRLCSTLAYVAKIGSVGTGDDQFNKPRRVCSDGTNIFVSDTYNSRIFKRICSDLSYVAKTGSQGSADNQFYYPTGMFMDDTYLYIGDTVNSRLKKHLISDLSYHSKIGTNGTGNDQFGNLWGVG
jgi:sugar lactone lactonase YvrE